jgi:hypothetical protein
MYLLLHLYITREIFPMHAISFLAKCILGSNIDMITSMKILVGFFFFLNLCL